MRAKNLAVAALGSLLGDVVAQRTPNQRATGDSRIINGQPADVADYPFLVSIRASEDGELGICGGAVIAPNVVLTAALCVTPEDPDEPLGSPYNSVNNYLMPLVVTAADVPANDPDLPVPTTNLVPTKAVVTSAGWADDSNIYEGLDIALLLLEEDLLDVEVASLPAAGTTYTAGEAFNIAGWGMCCAVAASRALALSHSRSRACAGMFSR
jgi:trypsin